MKLLNKILIIFFALLLRAEKEYSNSVGVQVSDYMDFMKENGVANQSFIKGTFIGDDLNFCNEIRSAIEITIAETKKLKSKD